MKHLVLAGLVYTIATLQTSSAGSTTLDPLLLLAACVVGLLPAQAAIAWAFSIGFVDGLIGAETTPGAVSLLYAIGAFVTRSVVSQFGERPAWVIIVGLLGFVAFAKLLVVLLTTPVESVDWSHFVFATVATWVASCVVVLLRRAFRTMVNRFRQSSGSGGAMGTPVGLELR